MRTSFVRALLNALCVWSMVAGGVPSRALATESASSPAVDSEPGFVMGRVFEIDKEKYAAYLKKLESKAAKEKGKPLTGRQAWEAIEEYLIPRGDVEVRARLIETNDAFVSPPTSKDGDYTIPRVPAGVFDFVLHYRGERFPVAQRLSAQVELGYIAELCFVLDRTEKIAWMVTAGPGRDETFPPWVPDQCVSQLTGCLWALTDDPGGFSRGLLLLFAGSGAAGAGLGIGAAADEESASPVNPR